MFSTNVKRNVSCVALDFDESLTCTEASAADVKDGRARADSLFSRLIVGGVKPIDTCDSTLMGNTTTKSTVMMMMVVVEEDGLQKRP